MFWVYGMGFQGVRVRCLVFGVYDLGFGVKQYIYVSIYAYKIHVHIFVFICIYSYIYTNIYIFSHVTHRTSRITRHASHVMHHALRITCHKSHVTHQASHGFGVWGSVQHYFYL